MLEATIIKVPQKKQGKNSAIILIHHTEQYRGKTNLCKLSCVQFKRHLREQIGQKINLYISIKVFLRRNCSENLPCFYYIAVCTEEYLSFFSTRKVIIVNFLQGVLFSFCFASLSLGLANPHITPVQVGRLSFLTQSSEIYNLARL